MNARDVSPKKQLPCARSEIAISDLRLEIAYKPNPMRRVNACHLHVIWTIARQILCRAKDNLGLN